MEVYDGYRIRVLQDRSPQISSVTLWDTRLLKREVEGMEMARGLDPAVGIVRLERFHNCLHLFREMDGRYSKYALLYSTGTYIPSMGSAFSMYVCAYAHRCHTNIKWSTTTYA
jgi:hypothetical protein